MQVNCLQETGEYRHLGFETSTLDTERAIVRTGIGNVLLAGGLPLSAATVAAMPSARRIIAKTSLHRTSEDGEHRIDDEACASALRDAKQRHPIPVSRPFSSTTSAPAASAPVPGPSTWHSSSSSTPPSLRSSP